MAAPLGGPERKASSAQSAQVARALITVSLAWATLGLAVPFGSSGGASNLDVTPLEWIISIAALVTALGLLLDLVHPWRSVLWRIGFSEMFTGFLWAASAAYELFLPGDATLLWRVGHALIYGGYAVLALTAWRWINVGRIRGQ